MVIRTIEKFKPFWSENFDWDYNYHNNTVVPNQIFNQLFNVIEKHMGADAKPMPVRLVRSYIIPHSNSKTNHMIHQTENGWYIMIHFYIVLSARPQARYLQRINTQTAIQARPCKMLLRLTIRKNALISFSFISPGIRVFRSYSCLKFGIRSIILF